MRHNSNHKSVNGYCEACEQDRIIDQRIKMEKRLLRLGLDAQKKARASQASSIRIERGNASRNHQKAGIEKPASRDSYGVVS